MVELLAGAAAAGLAGGAGVTGGVLAGSTIAAGATIAGGATGIATAAGLGALSSTVLTILSGVATAGSVLGHLQAADADANQATANAVQSDLEAGQTQLQDEQQGTTMRRELAKVLGENDVAVAGAGIDLNGGIADSQRADQKAQTATQLSISRQDDDMRRALLKARANSYRTQASSYRTGGLLAAVGDVAGFGTAVLQRG